MNDSVIVRRIDTIHCIRRYYQDPFVVPYQSHYFPIFCWLPQFRLPLLSTICILLAWDDWRALLSLYIDVVVKYNTLLYATACMASNSLYILASDTRKVLHDKL
jgi:hypothetical protein